MPESKYYMIWESNPDIDDTLREYLAAIYEGLSEEEQDIRFYEDNAERLEDERQNLAHIQPANGILVIGNLGLWSGRHYGILDKTKHQAGGTGWPVCCGLYRSEGARYRPWCEVCWLPRCLLLFKCCVWVYGF